MTDIEKVSLAMRSHDKHQGPLKKPSEKHTCPKHGAAMIATMVHERFCLTCLVELVWERSNNGKEYPCKPDIFEATYELVEPGCTEEEHGAISPHRAGVD